MVEIHYWSGALLYIENLEPTTDKLSREAGIVPKQSFKDIINASGASTFTYRYLLLFGKSKKEIDIFLNWPKS